MRLLEFLSKCSKPFTLLAGFTLIGLLSLVDHLTGYELTIAIFYAFPVALIAWQIGRTPGVIAAAVSAITLEVSNAMAGQVYSHPAIQLWNTTARGFYFVFVALLLCKLKDIMERDRSLARTDSLTEVVNSRAFHEIAQTEINRARRYAHVFTIAYIDLDNFKAVNDQFGHSVGDLLLRTIAKAMRDSLRATDTIARLGGDEFAILLPEVDYEAASVVIHKIQQLALSEMRQHQWPVTLSIGALTCVDPPSSVDEIIKCADGLMYSVKNSGKNKIKHDLYERALQEEVASEI